MEKPGYSGATCVMVALLFGGCGRDTLRPGYSAVLTEQIRKADQSLLREEVQRDLDGAMALIAPQAVFQPPGAPSIRGHEAIRRFYREQWFTLPFTDISGEVDTIVVASSGDLAYIDGRSRLTLEVSGERILAEGKYLGVWRRIEGQWLLAAISWNANEPSGS